MNSHAGVYSDRSDLVAGLRAACPDWTFSDGSDRDASRIAVVDSGVDRPAGKSIVRVLLVESVFDGPRKHGELVVERDAFLRAPADYLAFAGDLADAAMHAAQLEQESAYLRQIHELMTMVDAD